MLTIDDIEMDSLIWDWNTSHDVSLRLFIGNTITAVNGATYDAFQMLRLLSATSKGDELMFTVATA